MLLMAYNLKKNQHVASLEAVKLAISVCLLLSESPSLKNSRCAPGNYSMIDLLFSKFEILILKFSHNHQDNTNFKGI